MDDRKFNKRICNSTPKDFLEVRIANLEAKFASQAEAMLKIQELLKTSPYEAKRSQLEGGDFRDIEIQTRYAHAEAADLQNLKIYINPEPSGLSYRADMNAALAATNQNVLLGADIDATLTADYLEVDSQNADYFPPEVEAAEVQYIEKIADETFGIPKDILIGDVMFLKNIDPSIGYPATGAMSVEGIKGDTVTCIWFDGQDVLHRADYPMDALIPLIQTKKTKIIRKQQIFQSDAVKRAELAKQKKKEKIKAKKLAKKLKS